ncbi:anti-sigma factor [Porifericola rhodea]|uniref:anti-sigma factor n=1 Tax=Porifericola rhodea TaxID=930972 RepID=UPI0026656BF8|nr:anti-sigma factor [Porifericola rhodea]WKN30131.1 anti-sigma factor [Porifericola rhodea]
MNINEWIKSGIIEAYVLGELSEEKVREVEDMAQEYPEVQEEIEQTEMVMEELAMKSSIQPSNDVKNNILSKIDEQDKPTKSDRPIYLQSDNDKTKKLSLWQYISVAASILVLLSSALAIYYHQQWKSTENELTSYISRNETLAQEYQSLRSDFQQIQEQQEIFQNPAFTQVKLNGTDFSPNSFALVYWNAESEQVYLSPAGLPSPESGKQYQLWAIVDGKPQNAGVFDIQNALLDMEQIAKASAFAITLEPAGGSQSPTLEAMYVLGEV